MPFKLAIHTGTIFYKGRIQNVYPTDWELGNKVGSPDIVAVNVTDARYKDYTYLKEQWRRQLKTEAVSSDLANDVHKIRIYANAYRVSDNKGAITLSEVQSFLGSWNCPVVSSDVNEIVFDADIYQMCVSAAFFGRESVPPGIVFTPVSYNQSTGEHVIDADYSVTGLAPNAVSRHVVNSDGEVVSNDGSVVRYAVRRSDIRSRFLEDITHKFSEQIEKNRYRIAPSVVNTGIANGYALNATEAQLLNNLIDMMAQ